MKNASLLNFEKLRRKTIEAQKKNWWRKIRSIKGICNK